MTGGGEIRKLDEETVPENTVNRFTSVHKIMLWGSLRLGSG